MIFDLNGEICFLGIRNFFGWSEFFFGRNFLGRCTCACAHVAGPQGLVVGLKGEGSGI